jgi:lambda repressor-like predicted transcriptional regulator
VAFIGSDAKEGGITMRILSLGAGVQSSTLALMIAKGEVPMVDAAIFADTGAEPKVVYGWLRWLEGELPFPVHRVSNGSLLDDVMNRKDGFNPIPAYMDAGMGRRQCTFQYKLRPVRRKMRELADGQRVECLVGISWDEAHRMKPTGLQWCTNVWPLVDLRMTRLDCIEWMRRNNYPSPPRSACTFCMFKGDDEWRDTKADPESWAQALAVDAAIAPHGEYLHRSLRRLDQIDFRNAADFGQADFFGNECEGMCGV